MKLRYATRTGMASRQTNRPNLAAPFDFQRDLDALAKAAGKRLAAVHGTNRIRPQRNDGDGKSGDHSLILHAITVPKRI